MRTPLWERYGRRARPARTSAPPASWASPSDSPKATKASATVTTGSSVDRIDAAVGPTRRSPAKNSPIAPTVETTARPPSQAKPERLTRRRIEVAAGEPGERQRRGRARAHQRAQRERRDPAGDALRAEHVRAVDDRRRQPEQRPDHVELARRAREHEDEAAAGERDGDRGPATRALASERDGGDGHDHREDVDEQRQQRGVEPLERGEVAAGLRAVANGAEREGEADVAAARATAARVRRRAARAAPRRARSGSPGACRPWLPRHRRACRISPWRRTRRRRRGRRAWPGS